MSKPKEVIRKYSLEDSEMLGTANVIRSFFLEDIADFTAYSPVFNAPFDANWQTAITSAETFVRDNTVIDQQVQLTEAVKQSMKDCREHYQGAKYFIERAFPDNISVWNEFGYNDYKEAKDRQFRLVEFMQAFYTAANKYKVKLIAVGFTQAMITEINTLRSALNTANMNQDNFKKNRAVLTRDRIVLLNSVYDTTEGVCRIGKLIYADDYAKYQRYVLPNHSPAPVSGVIEFDIDQTVLADIILKIAGNASATGVEQVNIDHGDGYESVATLIDGNLVSYTVTYNTAGVYHAQITPITANALAFIGVIQFDNCKLSGTMSIPAVVQPSGIQIPNNQVTTFNLQTASFTNLVSLIVFNNALVENSVNANLIGLDTNGKTNGIVNFGGGTNAAPTGAGLTAKNNLIAKGWTVITN